MPQSVPSIDYLHDYTEDIFKENNKRIANPTVIGASLFDITATYAVGDYVIKDGGLYKCKVSHTGAWVAADFDSTDIMNEVGSGGSGTISTCTALAANWTGNSAPYSQTITVQGLKADSNPILDIVISDTVSTGIEEQEQWNYVTKAITGANSLTLYCYEEKPTIDLNILIKLV